MSNFAAVFKQSPAETKRYVMDFTLDLASGESITTVTVNITQTGGVTGGPALAATNIALLPAVSGQVTGFAFFVSAGATACTYEVQFLVTTSLTQVLEEVVQYNLLEKL
jgi:hypothetical protein